MTSTGAHVKNIKTKKKGKPYFLEKYECLLSLNSKRGCALSAGGERKHMTNKELIAFLKSDLERIDVLDFRALVYEQIIERLEKQEDDSN